MKFLKFHKKFHFRGQNTQNPHEGYCVYPIIKTTQLSMELKFQNFSVDLSALLHLMKGMESLSILLRKKII